jgi:hypothetical protein
MKYSCRKDCENVVITYVDLLSNNGLNFTKKWLDLMKISLNLRQNTEGCFLRPQLRMYKNES